MEKTEKIWISGFWRRIGALIIDTVILAAVGGFLGLVLENTFAEMGAWGRLFGFFVALSYFGVMNSEMSGGQTPGKKALKLRVVNSSNESISLAKSMARYVVLATPFLISGINLENNPLFPYLIYPLSFIAFGGALSTLYLYLFNTRTRQSLHDLVVGSYVVNANASRQDVGPVWKPHFMVAAVLAIAATAIVPTFTIKMMQAEKFNDWLAVQEALHDLPFVTHSRITYGPKEVGVDVFLSENRVKDQELVKRIVEITVSNVAGLGDKEFLRITLNYGYNIGIWSKTIDISYKIDLTDLPGV